MAKQSFDIFWQEHLAMFPSTVEDTRSNEIKLTAKLAYTKGQMDLLAMQAEATKKGSKRANTRPIKVKSCGV